VPPATSCGRLSGRGTRRGATPQREARRLLWGVLYVRTRACTGAEVVAVAAAAAAATVEGRVGTDQIVPEWDEPRAAVNAKYEYKYNIYV
jgi:hypothetical protein